VREALCVSRSRKEQRRLAASPQNENSWMLAFSKNVRLRQELETRAEMLGLLDRKRTGFSWHPMRLLSSWQRQGGLA